MARYFFHHHDGTSHTDNDGTDFPSDQAAWEHGTALCGELIRDLSATMPNGQEYRLECLDETGRGVFAVNWQATALMQDD